MKVPALAAAAAVAALWSSIKLLAEIGPVLGSFHCCPQISE